MQIQYQCRFCGHCNDGYDVDNAAAMDRHILNEHGLVHRYVYSKTRFFINVVLFLLVVRLLVSFLRNL